MSEQDFTKAMFEWVQRFCSLVHEDGMTEASRDKAFTRLFDARTTGFMDGVRAMHRSACAASCEACEPTIRGLWVTPLSPVDREVIERHLDATGCSCRCGHYVYDHLGACDPCLYCRVSKALKRLPVRGVMP